MTLSENSIRRSIPKPERFDDTFTHKSMESRPEERHKKDLRHKNVSLRYQIERICSDGKIEHQEEAQCNDDNVKGPCCFFVCRWARHSCNRFSIYLFTMVNCGKDILEWTSPLPPCRRLDMPRKQVCIDWATRKTKLSLLKELLELPTTQPRRRPLRMRRYSYKIPAVKNTHGEERPRTSPITMEAVTKETNHHVTRTRIMSKEAK